jgi:hypothetical protein
LRTAFAELPIEKSCSNDLGSPAQIVYSLTVKQMALHRYPFRDRSGNLFWCRMATVQEVINDRRLTFAYLLRAPALQQSAPPASLLRAPSADAVRTLALLLPPSSPPEFWDTRWEQLTGLAASDLTGASRDLVLDWLFPREHDRSYVGDLLCQSLSHGAQAILELVSPGGSKPALCTFLPLSSSSGPIVPSVDISSTSLAGMVTPPAIRTSWLLLVAPIFPAATLANEATPLGFQSPVATPYEVDSNSGGVINSRPAREAADENRA